MKKAKRELIIKEPVLDLRSNFERIHFPRRMTYEIIIDYVGEEPDPSLRCDPCGAQAIWREYEYPWGILCDACKVGNESKLPKPADKSKTA